MRMISGLIVALLFATASCGNGSPKCIPGASVACACPSGDSGAQVCTALGAFAACSCGGSGSAVVTATTSSARPKGCTYDALSCEAFSTDGQVGWNLHKLVYEAGQAKLYAKALCLSRLSANSSDAVLAGASLYEASQAWESLGCREQAIAAVQASLKARPFGRSGWNETCALCARLSADCAKCTEPHVITEDDLIGKWSGTLETHANVPADYSTGAPATEDVTTHNLTFEIARQDGVLVTTMTNPDYDLRPELRGSALTGMNPRLEGDMLVDGSDDGGDVTSYSFAGDNFDRLIVKTLIKGRFGGISTGVYNRQ